MNKHYIVMDPAEKSAKYSYYGRSLAAARATAEKINQDTGMAVPIGYEVITASGTVRETGDAGIVGIKSLSEKDKIS